MRPAPPCASRPIPRVPERETEHPGPVECLEVKTHLPYVGGFVARLTSDAESSPIRYEPSSSPGRNLGPQSDLRSESSGLFIGSERSASARHHRGDINSDGFSRTPRAPRRVILDDAGRVVREGPVDGSDAASFANNNPDTSEANALGGQGRSFIWGTNVSIDDTFAAYKDFLRNFTKKYRMWADGMTETETEGNPEAESKPYWEALENMLLLGTTRLYLDVRDLKAYPRTVKVWHQLQAYPQEIVPIMDQSTHDLMLELARAEMSKQRSQSTAGNQASHQQSSQSSEPAFPSSERSEEPSTPRPQQEQQLNLEDQVSDLTYVVRPYGLDKSINLRSLNPSGRFCAKRLLKNAYNADSF